MTAASQGATSSKTGTKLITLATGHYAIRAEATQTITLTLSRHAAVLLKRFHKLKATLAITPIGTTAPVARRTIAYRFAR